MSLTRCAPWPVNLSRPFLLHVQIKMCNIINPAILRGTPRIPWKYPGAEIAATMETCRQSPLTVFWFSATQKDNRSNGLHLSLPPPVRGTPMNIQDVLLKGLGGSGSIRIASWTGCISPQNILRTRNIRLIPGEANRRGGKYAYAEWAISWASSDPDVPASRPQGKRPGFWMDIGCGTHLLAIASEPL